MRSGASVSQLLAVSLLPRAARISTSRYLVGFVSVTKKTPQRSIQTNPGSGQAACAPQCATSESVDAADLYAYVFTCTYKHMQSSGQLTEEPFKKNLEQGYRALETRVVARMKFFAGEN
jgi:hypothetical protein